MTDDPGHRVLILCSTVSPQFDLIERITQQYQQQGIIARIITLLDTFAADDTVQDEARWTTFCNGFLPAIQSLVLIEMVVIQDQGLLNHYRYPQLVQMMISSGKRVIFSSDFQFINHGQRAPEDPWRAEARNLYGIVYITRDKAGGLAEKAVAALAV